MPEPLKPGPHAEANPTKQEPAPTFEMIVGDGPVCADGVCDLPPAVRQRHE